MELATAKAVPVRSVKKALDLLDLVIEAELLGGTASLGALARRLKLPANTAHNLLKTLAACGYVRNSAQGIYVQGVKCRQLGLMNTLTTPAVQNALRSSLQQFATRAGEACLLTTLVNGLRVTLARADSTQAVGVSHATVEETPFFSKATGRILAAFATEEEREAIITRHGLPGALWEAIGDKAALLAALAKLRKRGWDCQAAPDEGLVGLACPVLTGNGNLWGALGLYAPAFRCPPARQRKLLADMRRFASELTALSAER